MTLPTNDEPLIFTAVRRDDATATFFDGTREGIFYLRRSTATGEILDPRAEQDSAGNIALEWIPAAGTATLVSWAEVPHRSQGSDVPPSVIVAIVEFDEGPWWWTQLVGARGQDLVIGMTVTVRFVASGDSADDEYVPVFAACSAATADQP